MTYWGNFENEVSHLLSLQGWNVTQESLLRSKKVDLVISKRIISVREFKIAVECKSSSHKLTKKDVELIYASYITLLQNNDVDEILIVTANGISPAAMTYCHDNNRITHLTFLQLESSILNFDSYVQGIISEYRRKGIKEFYIDQLALDTNSNSIKFAQFFEEWLASDKSEPIAVLGGYGMGKSTLALKLAYDLAIVCQKNAGARVPILIKLGGLATEQSLEGLLGKHLAAENSVTNYQFDILMEMNRRGRFVIFLDGFDEMKKTMSWDDMKYNFLELFRLIGHRSKVVVCGRPTVFLNDDEYMEILKGHKRVGKVIKLIPGAPQFTELFLQPFTNLQILNFITSYSNYLVNISSIKIPADRIERLIKAIKEKNNPIIYNIANRPVHLRMLVELLPYLDYDYSDSRVSTLYAEFIDYVTNRELEKKVRMRFSAYKLRTFIRSLAWWMWNAGMADGVSINKIDIELFKPYLKEDDDQNDIARDLLSGSILESKLQNKFYFPHRSFLEFLVAEQLAKKIRSGSSIQWDAFLTIEIGIYLRELFDKHEDFKSLLTSVSGYRGFLDNWVIDLMIDLADNPSDLFILNEFSPWPVVAFSVGIMKSRWKHLKKEEVISVFRQHVFRHDINHIESEQYKYLLQFLYLRMRHKLRERDLEIQQEIYTYMKSKYKAVRYGELRIEAAEVISGLSEKYCFVTAWKRIINKKEFMYAKERIINKKL